MFTSQGEKTQEILVKEFGKTRVGFCKQVDIILISSIFISIFIFIILTNTTAKIPFIMSTHLNHLLRIESSSSF